MKDSLPEWDPGPIGPRCPQRGYGAEIIKLRLAEFRKLFKITLDGY